MYPQDPIQPAPSAQLTPQALQMAIARIAQLKQQAAQSIPGQFAQGFIQGPNENSANARLSRSAGEALGMPVSPELGAISHILPLAIGALNDTQGIGKALKLSEPTQRAIAEGLGQAYPTYETGTKLLNPTEDMVGNVRSVGYGDTKKVLGKMTKAIQASLKDKFYGNK